MASVKELIQKNESAFSASVHRIPATSSTLYQIDCRLPKEFGSSSMGKLLIGRMQIRII
jgi:hypothetical protein